MEAAPAEAAPADVEAPMDTDDVTAEPNDVPPASTQPPIINLGEDDDDEKLCRYCFDDEEYGQLLSPCACSGGQKWVHMKCLRRWQRMVLVTQPTHPSFYRDDVRHHECNVCKTEFTCPPPTRHELMESFTGPEIAAYLEPGCVIGAHKVFSEELASQLETLPPAARSQCSYMHWIGGCYLITSVTADDGEVSIPVEDADELQIIRMRLGADLSIALRGTRLVLLAKGSLEGVAEADLSEKLGEITAPCTIVLGDNRKSPLQSIDACDFQAFFYRLLAIAEPKTCGDDSVCALNLTRQIDASNPHLDQEELETALKNVRESRKCTPHSPPQLDYQGRLREIGCGSRELRPAGGGGCAARALRRWTGGRWVNRELRGGRRELDWLEHHGELSRSTFETLYILVSDTPFCY